MQVDYLREFVEVCMSLNLSKAARSLHVSQPSLSKHVAALEKECKTPLLTRSSSRISLTPAGQVLLEEAIKLIRMHDEAIARIQSLKNVSVLRIGGLFENANSIALVNRALAQVNAEEFTVSVAYQDYRHRPQSELLNASKIDLAITILSDNEEIGEGLERVFLFRDPMICLVKESHPLAQRDKLHIADLDGQSILQPVGSYSSEHGRSTVNDIFMRHGIRPVEHPVFVHAISELSTVANEDFMLIMEHSMLATQPFAKDYRMITFYEDDASFAFYALYRKNTNNPALSKFMKALSAIASELERQ